MAESGIWGRRELGMRLDYELIVIGSVLRRGGDERLLCGWSARRYSDSQRDCCWPRHCADTLILPGVSPVPSSVFPSGSGEVR
jgi:hypothetical protein